MKRMDWGSKTTKLQVRTFGPPEVMLGNQPVQWRSESARQLFFYLLTHPLGQSRDHITEALWDASPDANTNNRFRVTVHRIRLALGWPEAVIEEYGRYRLALEVLQASDVAAFIGLLEMAQHQGDVQTRLESYQQAIALYQGEYLLGHEGDWVWDVRDQLRARYVQTTLEVARLHWDSANLAASVEAQIQALKTDPFLGEQHHQRLMGCLWLTQGKYAAIEYYRRFVNFLQQELGDSPMTETIQLAQRIKRGDPPAGPGWELWPSEGANPVGSEPQKAGLKLVRSFTDVA